MSTSLSELEFLTFSEGIARIGDALKSLGIGSLSDDGGPIITSKDPVAKRIKGELSIKGLPSGFSKWQLPVFFEGEGAQFFFTLAEPGTEADEHAHSNGAAMRVILSGSIEYGGLELTQGDWMFIPKDSPYSFKVGEMGAVIFYCYSCCCAIK